MSRKATNHNRPSFAGFHSPRYTQVPDEIFDQLMPILADAELRVLLYIVRRTFGFKRDTDNISLSQMVDGIVTRDGTRLDAGAGVSKASAVRAVKGLLELGVITKQTNRSAERGNGPRPTRSASPIPPCLTMRQAPLSHHETSPCLTMRHTTNRRYKKQISIFRNSKGLTTKN